MKKIRFNYLKILLICLSIFTCQNSLKSENKPFEEISSGLSEKGIYLDFINRSKVDYFFHRVLIMGSSSEPAQTYSCSINPFIGLV